MVNFRSRDKLYKYTLKIEQNLVFALYVDVICISI